MQFRRYAVLATALSLLALAPAHAADNYPIKDSAGATRTIRAKDVGGVLTPQSIPTDVAGIALFSSANPGLVAQKGAWTFSLTGYAPVRLQDGAGNALTSGAVGSARALDVRILDAAGNQITSFGGGGGGGSVSVSNFPATQPVSAAALPLPTGAATSARQALPGTAGTPSSEVLSVQGVAGGTPIPVAGTQPASIATGQASCSTASAQAVPARAGRRNVVLIQEGTTLVRVGASGVTTSTGVPLPGTAYSALTIDGAAAVHCVTASGTQTVSFIETY